MGVWYICRNDARVVARIAQAKAQLRRHGHPEPCTIATPHFTGIVSGYIHESLPAVFRAGDDFIAVAGTLFYRGEKGEAALRLLLADYSPPFDRWDDLLGHFAALVFKQGRLFLFTDWSASFHVYQTFDRSVFSTSFLSTAGSLDSVSFNPHAVYEFVFFGMPLGSDSVFNEISRPARTHELELGETVRVHEAPRRLPIVRSEETLDEIVDRVAANLRRAFSVPVRHFRDNIQCPLSGGFDSRLVLSLLRDLGSKPHVYVYGRQTDDDVVIAKHIASREGFPLEIFEKASFKNVAPDEFADVVERNFHEMDGTPMGGGMFDAGGNSRARHDRATGGGLAISGAAGEIFRNYFYLPDRPARTSAVVDAFYACFDPADCTSLFDSGNFLEQIDRKLQTTLEVGAEPIGRLELERAYPLFRCPPAFGREISMVGRFGPYFVPFCEYPVTREAASIPVRWRTHGVFQSRLLERISPRLAAYPSAYGHSFIEPPNWRHRLSDWTSLLRPPWVRRYSFRMKRAFRKENPRVGLMSDEFLGKVVDLGFPAMRKFFAVDRLLDTEHYKAIATLEYLAHYISPRLRL